jgi:hypothetical protein
VTSLLPKAKILALQKIFCSSFQLQINFQLTTPILQHQDALTAPPHASRTMVVRIRLARFGKRHKPFYNIVVTQAR